MPDLHAYVSVDQTEVLPLEVLEPDFSLALPTRGKIASVCSRWQAVINETPVFWKVLNIQTEKWSSRYALNALKRSASLPIKISVKSRDPIDSPPLHISSDIEQLLVREIVYTITPFLPRCTVISFLLLFSSSIPRVADLPTIRWDLLQDLSLERILYWQDDLESVTNDVPVPSIPSSSLGAPTNLSNIRNLSLDGWNFLNVHDSLKESQWPTFDVCDLLTIDHYTGSPRMNILSFVPFFARFTAVRLLHLHAFVSAEEDVERGPDDDYRGDLAVLDVTDIASDVVDALLRHLEPVGVYISDCDLSGVGSLPTGVVFQDMYLDGTFLIHLRRLLQGGPGETPEQITFRFCSYLTDDFLDMFGKTRELFDGTIVFEYAPQLRKIQFVSSKGFTFPAFRRMVESRRGLAEIKLTEIFLDYDMNDEEKQWYFASGGMMKDC
ncbi:hypothetical protein H0H93_010611 [Arthromyces matolae]|nr:hypothetical protein H0H93_010611 [Arthromyces matolae]